MLTFWILWVEKVFVKYLAVFIYLVLLLFADGDMSRCGFRGAPCLGGSFDEMVGKENFSTKTKPSCLFFKKYIFGAL